MRTFYFTAAKETRRAANGRALTRFRVFDIQGGELSEIYSGAWMSGAADFLSTVRDRAITGALIQAARYPGSAVASGEEIQLIDLSAASEK